MHALKSIAEVRQHLVVDARSPVAASLLEIVADCGVLLKGHFGLQSGNHSEYFVRFAQIGRDRDAIARVAQHLLDELGRINFDVVLCPESGGYFLGQAIAERAGAKLGVSAINALRQPSHVLRRGEIPEGASVLIANDVVTTGHSLVPLIDATAGVCGTRIAAVATFASLRPQQFSRFRADRGLAGAHLVSATWPTFAPVDCPICRTHESLVPAAELN
jgi:orotate phosphoribosyltransferase